MVYKLIVLLVLLSGGAAWSEVPTLEDLRAEFAALEEREASLKARHEQLRQSGESPAEVLRRAQARLAALDPSEREALSRVGKRGFTELPESGPLREILTDLEHTASRVEAFHAGYDEYSLRRLEFLLNRLRYVAQNTLDTESASWPSATRARALALQAEMEAHYRTYLKEAERYVGGPADRARRRAFRNFMKANERFASLVDGDKRSFGEWVGWKFRKISSTLDAVGKKAFAFGPEAPGTLYKYLTGRPVRENVGRGFERLAALDGKSFEVQGRENLPGAPGPKTVTLFLLPHNNKILDTAALSRLNLADMGVLFNPSADVPKAALPLIRHIRDLVVVGVSGADALGDLSRKVENGQSNIMIFPEGSMGLAMEGRPAPRSFYRMLVPAIRAKGYQVRVVPVNLPENAQAGTSTGSHNTAVDGGPRLPIVIGEPISEELVSLMYGSKNQQLIWDFTRQSWLDGANSAERPVAGMPEIRATVEALDQVTVASLRCQGHLERLSTANRAIFGR